MNEKLSIIVMTCDAYNDLWDNFFTLKEKYWPDCKYPFYLVVEEMDYSHKGVNVIKCGRGLNWAARLRFALESVDCDYCCMLLDDFYITHTIDSAVIAESISFMDNKRVSYLRMGDAFGSMSRIRNREYIARDIMKIPSNMKYGVSTAEAIWNRVYLLGLLGNGDYSAWQFELDRCKEAETTGMPGVLLYDERNPLNITKLPVVIQGKYYPKAIRAFRRRGDTLVIKGRQIMGFKETFRYDLISFFYRIPWGRGALKKIGKFFGLKFAS